VTTGRAVVDGVGTRLLSVVDRFARLKHEAEVISSGPFPVDVERVYDAVKDRIGTAVVRDPVYLDWRFNANPEERTEVVVTRDHGRASGYLVFTMKGTTATVKDWLAVDTDAISQLFTAFLREARTREATSASLIALETHPDLPVIRRFGELDRRDLRRRTVSVPADGFGSVAMVHDTRRSRRVMDEQHAIDGRAGCKCRCWQLKQWPISVSSLAAIGRCSSICWMTAG
jgi:hypothetical protein